MTVCTIGGGDVDLFKALDIPREVVDAVFDHPDKRGFEPSPGEQEILLELQLQRLAKNRERKIL